MGTGLGAHLDDVLAKHTATEADLIVTVVIPPVVVLSVLVAPLPFGEITRPPVFNASFNE